MTEENVIFSVGKDKDGDFDFSIRCSVCDLSRDDLLKFREMIIVGIGTMEEIIRNARLNEHPTAQESKTDKI